MLTRFPDKPLASSVAVLPSLRDGQWLAEFKYDGWRVWIEVGVVLKRVDGRYIGSARGCCQNPAWLKVKWRDGAGGNKRIA